MTLCGCFVSLEVGSVLGCGRIMYVIVVRQRAAAAAAAAALGPASQTVCARSMEKLSIRSRAVLRRGVCLKFLLRCRIYHVAAGASQPVHFLSPPRRHRTAKMNTLVVLTLWSYFLPGGRLVCSLSAVLCYCLLIWLM